MKSTTKNRGYLPRNNPILLLVVLCGLFVMPTAWSQGISPRSPAEKALLNQNAVGLATGGPGGTYSRMGVDLSTLLNNPSRTDPFRVVVSLSQGSVNNIQDLFDLRNIDLAIVQSDVLEAFSPTEDARDELRKRFRLIAPLHREEIHILGRAIHSLEGLEGKRVNIDAPGSGTQITARHLFAQLNIHPQFTEMTSLQARDALLGGQIDALVYVVGRPADLFKGISGEKAMQADLSFVPIDRTVQNIDEYGPAQLTSDDYPNLIGQNETVPTRAVTAVMAVYAWSPQQNPVRYLAAKRFVERFFDHAGELSHSGFSKSWCAVDLGKSVLGWQRFEPAADWLSAHPGGPTRLCAAAGSQCECAPEPPDLNACQEHFQAYYKSQGLPIPNVTLPIVRPIFEEWKQRNPNC
ncbi:MAG TPA: TAXI family TRAP transporter solute-binding subunit [Rhodopila sp.]|uniref:TAXI family TRAP transporter solute-binding subunit n=1 Tax=Rhodopila sp. TaxID=2480087 RepID=UPI002CE0B56F|nr:TAXI family TRAP transporter solute-binding subunit [Rhodopila sp.]HVY16040.1 TAXI family TRAP transporter solute-binding subunit [Rhodopila sp.]